MISKEEKIRLLEKTIDLSIEENSKGNPIYMCNQIIDAIIEIYYDGNRTYYPNLYEKTEFIKRYIPEFYEIEHTEMFPNDYPCPVWHIVTIGNLTFDLTSPLDHKSPRGSMQRIEILRLFKTQIENS